MENPKTAEEFCRFLWQKYLVERRYDILDEVVDPDLTVIGTGAHEISRNLNAFVASMGKESVEWEGSFIIKDQWYQTTKLSDEFSLVIGELIAKENSENNILFDIRFRFSAVLRSCNGGWKVVHMHQSVPDSNQLRDEFFPHRILEKDGQQIIYNLRHDSMTGLLNRLYLKETVNRIMQDLPGGQLLMIDIDKFKSLNDNYGHPFGDRVLILFSESLKSSLPEAVIGRVGGDEFVVYLPGGRELDAVKLLVNDLKKDWAESQKSLHLENAITCSIGISRCPQDGDTYEILWQKADEALYFAKKSGKSDPIIY